MFLRSRLMNRLLLVFLVLISMFITLYFLGVNRLHFMPVKLDATYYGGIKSDMFLFVGVSDVEHLECKVIDINGEVLVDKDGSSCQFVVVDESIRVPNRKILTDIDLRPGNKFDVVLIRRSFVSDEMKHFSKLAPKIIPRVGNVISLGLGYYYSKNKSDISPELALSLSKGWDFKALQNETYTVIDSDSDKESYYNFVLGGKNLVPWFKKKGRSIEIEFVYTYNPLNRLWNALNEKYMQTSNPSVTQD